MTKIIYETSLNKLLVGLFVRPKRKFYLLDKVVCISYVFSFQFVCTTLAGSYHANRPMI
jgi:hypothetical protein